MGRRTKLLHFVRQPLSFIGGTFYFTKHLLNVGGHSIRGKAVAAVKSLLNFAQCAGHRRDALVQYAIEFLYGIVGASTCPTDRYSVDRRSLVVPNPAALF